MRSILPYSPRFGGSPLWYRVNLMLDEPPLIVRTRGPTCSEANFPVIHSSPVGACKQLENGRTRSRNNGDERRAPMRLPENAPDTYLATISPTVRSREFALVHCTRKPALSLWAIYPATPIMSLRSAY